MNCSIRNKYIMDEIVLRLAKIIQTRTYWFFCIFVKFKPQLFFAKFVFERLCIRVLNIGDSNKFDKGRYVPNTFQVFTFRF